MMRRSLANLMAWLRWIGLSPRRLEWLALFPLLALAAATYTDRTIAEVTGVILPCLLILDVLGRWLLPVRKDVDTGALDSRTGLPMRPALDAALADAAAMSPRYSTACLFLRLDGHDQLAQRWGAADRDEILRRTAERVQCSLRPGDTIAIVEAGTFAIALEPCPADRLEDLGKLAQRLCKTVADPIHISGASAHVTTSVGVASTADLRVVELASAAEAALLEAQKSGQGTIRHFSRDLKDRLSRTAELVRGVDHALTNGEIRAWFQPQICTDTGQIIGFEALARWHHPHFGTLSPAQFLDAVAHAGRMSELGEVMLQNALAALASWDRKGLNIPTVAVNFSAEELRDPDLATRVKWEVDRFDMRPDRITVEILESVAAEGPDDAIWRNVDQFATHGFHLDLDDFGTGQASVQNIRRFRVQRIKIDRSFVTGIDTDPQQQSVVSAILALAQHLGVETLAEGVETPGEHSILAQLGCGAVQGFGLARPMPFEDTFAWIDGHKLRTMPPPVIGRKTG